MVPPTHDHRDGGELRDHPAPSQSNRLIDLADRMMDLLGDMSREASDLGGTELGMRVNLATNDLAKVMGYWTMWVINYPPRPQASEAPSGSGEPQTPVHGDTWTRSGEPGTGEREQ